MTWFGEVYAYETFPI